MTDLQKEINKLSKLVQYRKKDKSTIERLAQLNVWRRQINIENRFESSTDKELANKIFDNYLQNYEFQNFTDVQNVADLCYEEVLRENVQKEISKIITDEKTKFVPDKLIQSLHNIESRIWELKEKAGIVGTKEKDDLTALQEYEKKMKVYIAFHRNEFTFYSPFICNNCGKKDAIPVLIRRRCNKENFEILKHPAFSGRFLYNIEIMKDVREEKITKEQAARYLRTSVKYIDWVLENEYKIIEIDDVKKEDIDEFVNNNPNLLNVENYQGENK